VTEVERAGGTLIVGVGAIAVRDPPFATPHGVGTGRGDSCGSVPKRGRFGTAYGRGGAGGFEGNGRAPQSGNEPGPSWTTDAPDGHAGGVVEVGAGSAGGRERFRAHPRPGRHESIQGTRVWVGLAPPYRQLRDARGGRVWLCSVSSWSDGPRRRGSRYCKKKETMRGRESPDPAATVCLDRDDRGGGEGPRTDAAPHSTSTSTLVPVERSPVSHLHDSSRTREPFVERRGTEVHRPAQRSPSAFSW